MTLLKPELGNWGGVKNEWRPLFIQHYPPKPQQAQRVNREKTRLLNAVARSPQAAKLYLHFLNYGCQPIDPYRLGLPRATTYRLVKLFEARGLVEKATRRKLGLRGNWKWTWKLVC